MTNDNRGNDPKGSPSPSGQPPKERVVERVVIREKKKGKKTLIALIVAALAGVGIWRALECGGFGLGGSGKGKKSDSTATTPDSRKPDAARQRPITVVIDGDKYSVDEKIASLNRIVELAQGVPGGKGPAVIVLRKGTSTARAEDRLSKAFKAKKIDFVMRDHK